MTDFENLQNTILYNFCQYKYISTTTNTDFEVVLKKVTNSQVVKKNTYKYKKDKLSYKINLLLNKLSSDNQINIIREFIETFTNINIVLFEEIQRYVYIRLLSDISFITIYIHFIISLTYIYNKIYEYNLDFLIMCVERKFNNIYDVSVDNDSTLSNIDIIKFKFLDNIENNETVRLNNLKIITELYNYKVLSKELIDYCTHIILNSKHIIDIHSWLLTIEITDELKNLLTNDVLKRPEIKLREKTLIENLINN